MDIFFSHSFGFSFSIPSTVDQYTFRKELILTHHTNKTDLLGKNAIKTDFMCHIEQVDVNNKITTIEIHLVPIKWKSTIN